MRTTAIVLGCIGGGLLVLLGIPLTIMHPYGLAFVLAGGFGITGGVTARKRRVLPGVFLSVATAMTVLASLTATGVGIVVLFVPSILLLLAMIFAFVAPVPSPPVVYYPPPGYPPYYPPR